MIAPNIPVDRFAPQTTMRAPPPRDPAARTHESAALAKIAFNVVR
jgi:hypothetical protein